MNNVCPSIFALMPSGMEWLWVLLIVVLLFGGAKLPSLARGLGQSIKEFKKASNTDDEQPKPGAPAEPKKPETTTTHGSN
jgi:sec-independent protein translocase protein TatA